MGNLFSAFSRRRARPSPASQQGYIDARTTEFVQGWLRDPADPAARLAYRVMLDGAVLAHGTGDQTSETLRQVGVGDGSYAFTAHFSPPLTSEQRDRVGVHGPFGPLELAPGLVTEIPSQMEGYVDERSTAHVTGWLRDANRPDARLCYRIMLDGGVLAEGIGDQPSDTLRQVGVGDGTYAFTVPFDPPLTRSQRDRVEVHGPAGSLPLAPGLITYRVPPRYVGYVDERSAHHLAGWVWNEAEPGEQVEFDVLHGAETVMTGVAGSRSAALVALGVGDGHHSFLVILPNPVSDPSRLSVRVRGAPFTLVIAPTCTGRFEPVGHVAMDIVNNCNLRCPFCTYDYTGVRTTQFMTDATFDAAIRLLPYVREGNFWLSCLHEATIHPELLRFIDRVPIEYRDRLMYTTNLAKRMPDAYFAQLGASGMHHINVSLESLVPETYERLRKGARYGIFHENWAKLIAACATGTAPPRLRYNMMAYRSNLHELPGLVDLLLTEKLAWQVEIRYTFDEAHIPDAFRTAEYLDESGWDWLAAQLAHHDPLRVLLLRPPASAGPASTNSIAVDTVIPRPSYPLGMRIDWDGTLFVYSETTGAGGIPVHTNHLTTAVAELNDPAAFIRDLVAEFEHQDTAVGST